MGAANQASHVGTLWMYFICYARSQWVRLFAYFLMMEACRMSTKHTFVCGKHSSSLVIYDSWAHARSLLMASFVFCPTLFTFWRKGDNRDQGRRGERPARGLSLVLEVTQSREGEDHNNERRRRG
ncbi:hypothetical protein C5167_007703 [Papaver somniferum]|nr:hypothetical protein C5167_007703 [Papaver somniferum]